MFPAPLDALWKLRWVELEEEFAVCDWDTRTVYLDPRWPTEVVIENLFHEWAHARELRTDLFEESYHDAVFYRQLRLITNRYHEEGGVVEVEWI